MVRYHWKKTNRLNEVFDEILKKFDPADVVPDVGQKLERTQRSLIDVLDESLVVERDNNKLLAKRKKIVQEQIEEMQKAPTGLYRGNVRYDKHGAFGYNDLIYYTQFIIDTILAESVNQTDKLLKTANTRSLN